MSSNYREHSSSNSSSESAPLLGSNSQAVVSTKADVNKHFSETPDIQLEKDFVQVYEWDLNPFRVKARVALRSLVNEVIHKIIVMDMADAWGFKEEKEFKLKPIELVRTGYTTYNTNDKLWLVFRYEERFVDWGHYDSHLVDFLKRNIWASQYMPGSDKFKRMPKFMKMVWNELVNGFRIKDIGRIDVDQPYCFQHALEKACKQLDLIIWTGFENDYWAKCQHDWCDCAFRYDPGVVFASLPFFAKHKEWAFEAIKTCECSDVCKGYALALSDCYCKEKFDKIFVNDDYTDFDKIVKKRKIDL